MAGPPEGKLKLLSLQNFNPFKPNGISHYYQFDQFIYVLRVVDKVGLMPTNKCICHASGIYRKYEQIPGNTGKYDLEAWIFTFNI